MWNFIHEHGITSEDPINEVWDLLSLNTESQILNQSHTYKISSANEKAIRLFYLQSRQLFNSGKGMDILASPLLDFYSYAQLTKIFVMVELQLNSEAIAQSHGLKFIMPNKNSDPNQMRIRITKNGFFSQIQKALRQEKDFDFTNLEITVSELLHCDIDIFQYDTYESYCLPIENYRLETIDEEKKRRRIEIELIGSPKKKTFEDAIRNRPKIDFSDFQYRNIQNMTLPGCTIFNDHIGSFSSFLIEADFKGQIFIVPTINIQGHIIQLFQIEILYLLLFAISNLVRYYPSEWNKIVNSEFNIWQIRKAISLARRSFPNYILNYLSHEKHVVLPPGILRWQSRR